MKILSWKEKWMSMSEMQDVDSQIINLDENLEKSYSQKENNFEINSNKVNLDSIQTHEDLLKQKKILEDSHSNKREKYETLEIELKIRWRNWE